MDGNRKYFLAVIIALLIYPAGLSAGTRITVTEPAPQIPIPLADLNQITSDMSSFISPLVNSIGLGMNRAMVLGTVIGYPMGDPILSGGTFDHFFIGFTGYGALANTRSIETFDMSSMPGGIVSPAIYFGFSLGKSMDLMFKLMWYDDIIMVPPLDLGFVRLSALDLYIAGAKFRWNVIKRKKLFPGLIEFAGLTLGFGLDFSYGTLGMEGTLPLPPQSFTIGAPVSATISATLTPDYSLTINWLQIFGSIEVVGHMDFFSFIDLYLGLGLAGGYGYTVVNVTMDGLMTTTDPAFLAQKASGEIIQFSLVSRNTYYPVYLLPYLKLGLDINLFVIRLTVEGDVNLMNFEDVGIQLALRTQW